jgi:hypothetical protein
MSDTPSPAPIRRVGGGVSRSSGIFAGGFFIGHTLPASRPPFGAVNASTCAARRVCRVKKRLPLLQKRGGMPSAHVKSVRARADPPPMLIKRHGDNGDGGGGVATMEELMEGEAAAHPAPSDKAPEIAAEAGDKLRTDLEERGELPAGMSAHAPSPGSGIYPPGFDPNLHYWPPTRTARKTWRLRRKGDPMSPPPPTSILDDPAAAAAPSVGIDAQTAQHTSAAQAAAVPIPLTADRACHYLDTGFSMIAMVGGETWRPTEDEHREMKAAVTRYIQAKNISDLPPGWALLLVCATFAVPRVFMLPWFQQKLIEAGVIPDPAADPGEVSDNGAGGAESDTAPHTEKQTCCAFGCASHCAANGGG